MLYLFTAIVFFLLGGIYASFGWAGNAREPFRKEFRGRLYKVTFADGRGE